MSGRIRVMILAAHLAALLSGLAYAGLQWGAILDETAAVDQAQDMLDRLGARLTGTGAAGEAATAARRAEPFLQGGSATVAGAELQERVVAAVRKAGGTVTSSQIDTTSQAGSVPPSVVLTVSCQIASAALQGLLYGLEAGAPSLFLDQLSVETAAAEGRPGNLDAGETLKVAMTVSGYWNGNGKS